MNSYPFLIFISSDEMAKPLYLTIWKLGQHPQRLVESLVFSPNAENCALNRSIIRFGYQIMFIKFKRELTNHDECLFFFFMRLFEQHTI